MSILDPVGKVHDAHILVTDRPEHMAAACDDVVRVSGIAPPADLGELALRPATILQDKPAVRPAPEDVVDGEGGWSGTACG